MTTRYEAANKNGWAQVTNDNASAELIPRPAGEYWSPSAAYLYLEQASFSVYEAATGGGGVVKLLDTDGVEVWSAAADTVKDVVLDFGCEGIRLNRGVGLQAIVSDGQTRQASVSVGVKAHRAFR